MNPKQLFELSESGIIQADLVLSVIRPYSLRNSFKWALYNQRQRSFNSSRPSRELARIYKSAFLDISKRVSSKTKEVGKKARDFLLK